MIIFPKKNNNIIEKKEAPKTFNYVPIILLKEITTEKFMNLFIIISELCYNELQVANNCQVKIIKSVNNTHQNCDEIV